MTSWLRLWHDMPTDPKWRTISRNSGQPIPSVIAVFIAMLTNASLNADVRGELLAWEDEDIAACLDMEANAVTSIRKAMQGKVLDGDRLTGWERRQPRREDNSSTRVRKHRDAKVADKQKKSAVKRSVTLRNAPDSDTDSDSEVDSDSKSESESNSNPGLSEDSPLPRVTPALIELANRIGSASGVKIQSGKIQFEEQLTLIQGWLDAGFTHDEIVAIIERVAAKAPSPIASLRYFDTAIRQELVVGRNGLSQIKACAGPKSAWRPDNV